MNFRIANTIIVYQITRISNTELWDLLTYQYVPLSMVNVSPTANGKLVPNFKNRHSSGFFRFMDAIFMR